MMNSFLSFSRRVVVLGVFLIGSQLFAQGTQTGAISGTVTTPDGISVPAVTVTVSSPALQGTRTSYSGENGDYIVRGLPPGRYNVRFQLEGLQEVKRDVDVDLGGTKRLDTRMTPLTTAEAITVTAESPTALTTTQLGTNYKSEELRKLPMARTLAGIAANTPGVTQNTPNAGQVRINGAFAYDNVFLVDGTDVNDNLFGAANNLFIEEAIAETQVLTGGISAEYGRFTGGVVNAITKSGSNDFGGTLRGDLSKPNWTERTSYEKENKIKRSDTLSEVYSATVGGPIVRDWLWFFLAGRSTESSEERSLVETGIPVATTTENPRYEIKLTGSIASNHTLQGSYLSNETAQNDLPTFTFTMDPRAKVNRTLPNERWAVFYNGILTPQLFTEVKYSEKTFGFRNSGGTSVDILDSPFFTRTGPLRHYNAPYFDSTDPEDRNNQDLTATLSYFLSSRVIGSHDVKGGYEQYISTRTGGNSQSSTGYVFQTNFKRDADGKAAVDANGRYIPVFVPAPQSGFTLLQNWLPIRGASTDIKTQSLFINDSWNLNPHLSFNLGARYEQVDGEATGAITTVDSSRITPRLAASLDIRADGRFKVDATYSQYSGKYNERQFAQNTNVGIPNLVVLQYNGPAGEGLNFAPGFNLSNYQIIAGSFPLQNVSVDPDVKSPVVDEWTLSGGFALGRRGFAKLTYSNREWKSFLEDFTNTSTGFSEVTISPTVRRNLDNRVIGNTDEMSREYEAVQLLSQFRFTDRWSLQGNYTYEITNHGNFVGEATNQPGNSSLFGDYPELYTPERHFPTGRMPGFQEHRLRLLNTNTLPLGMFGKLDFGLIYSYDSAGVFNYVVGGVPLTTDQRARLATAGYKSPPTSQTLYFGDLGAGEYEDQHQLDLALTFGLPLFRVIEPWVKVDVLNVTNEAALRVFDTTISVDNSSPKDEFGLPTGFTRGARFGKATSAGNFQVPLTYSIAAGIRF